MSPEPSHSKRSAAWRLKREAQGLLQTQVWVPEHLRTAIDEKIRAGEFQNRSEAFNEALDRMIGEKSCSS